MKATLGFLALLIGGAGIGGQDNTICIIITLIGLAICFLESKKIDVPTDQSRNVY